MRDVIQNHLLQIVSYLAMEAPSHAYGEGIRDEQAEGSPGTSRPMTLENMVRGQFRGYRDEPGVAKDSYMATYAALRMFVDSWRWEGVPFYVRAGKSLATTCTEVSVELKVPPQVVFAEARPSIRQHGARFRPANPEMIIAVGARKKKPGEKMEGEAVELVVTEGATEQGARCRWDWHTSVSSATRWRATPTHLPREAGSSSRRRDG